MFPWPRAAVGIDRPERRRGCDPIARMEPCSDCDWLPTPSRTKSRPRPGCGMSSARRGRPRRPPSHAPATRSLTSRVFDDPKSTGEQTRTRLRQSMMQAAAVMYDPLTASATPNLDGRAETSSSRHPIPQDCAGPRACALMPPLCRTATIDIDRLPNSRLPLHLRPRRRGDEPQTGDRVEVARMGSRSPGRERLDGSLASARSKRSEPDESLDLVASDVRARPRLPCSLSGVRLRLRSHLRELT
jgi:hypothetical protein